MEKKQNKNDTKTVADIIWEEIKDKELQMFSLPNQTVKQYCKPVLIDPSKCYLIASATSTLPALEEALKLNFSVERVERFIVVTKK